MIERSNSVPSPTGIELRVAQILPIHSSQDYQGYTYLIPVSLLSDIRIGQMVSIPLREDVTEGIVARIAECPAECPIDQLKEICSILDPEPILTSWQIGAILSYAEKHAIHIHKVLSFFLPAPVRNRITKYGMPKTAQSAQSLATGQPFLTHWTESSKESSQNPRIELIHYLSSNLCFLEIARRILNPGTVVIAPSDVFVEKIMLQVREKMGVDTEKIGVYSSNMTETARARFWIDSVSGKYDALIWTRRLVTYNLAQFRTILYLEDSLFKELLHSFHSYDAFELLRDTIIPDQELFVYSSTPSIEIMSLALAGKINFSTRT